MRWQGHSARYVVESGKASRYVLLDYGLSIRNTGLTREVDKFPLMMELGKSQPPDEIDIMDVRDGLTYDFVRVSGAPAPHTG